MIEHEHRGKIFKFDQEQLDAALDYVIYQRMKRERRCNFYWLATKFQSLYGLPKAEAMALADLALAEFDRL